MHFPKLSVNSDTMQMVGKMILTKAEQKLDYWTKENFIRLHDMWIKSARETGFEHANIFDFDKSKSMVEIKIPDELSKLELSHKSDEYDRFRSLMDDAHQAITYYLNKALKKYNTYTHTSTPANIYVMYLVSYLLQFVRSNGQAKCDQTDRYIKMIMAFLNKYQAVKRGNQRYPACRLAIEKLEQALNELKRIAANQSIQDTLRNLCSGSFDLAKIALNLSVKLVYPHKRVIQADKINIEGLQNGIVIPRILSREKPISLPDTGFFPLKAIKKIASYLSMAEKCCLGQSVDEKYIPSMDEIMASEVEADYEKYLDVLYSRTTRMWNFLSRNDFRPYYLGIKITPKRPESGLTADSQCMTANELKNAYNLVTNLLELTYFASTFRIICNSAQRTIINRGQVNFICGENYRDFFTILQFLLEKMTNKFDLISQKLFEIKQNVKSLNDPAANDTINHFNSLQKNLDDCFSATNLETSNLTKLRFKPAIIQSQAEEDDHRFKRLLLGIKQRLPSEQNLTKEHKYENGIIIEEVKARQNNLEGQLNILKKENVNLSRWFGGALLVESLSLLVLHQVDNDEYQSTVSLFKVLGWLGVTATACGYYVLQNRYSVPLISGISNNFANIFAQNKTPSADETKSQSQTFASPPS
ncbi:MAG: hypothetical protein JSR33_02295 [Proteobacteria bacterium]|nr:hypothetical protein [Pseudomonadota bacterium]